MEAALNEEKESPLICQGICGSSLLKIATKNKDSSKVSRHFSRLQLVLKILLRVFSFVCFLIVYGMSFLIYTQYVLFLSKIIILLDDAGEDAHWGSNV